MSVYLDVSLSVKISDTASGPVLGSIYHGVSDEAHDEYETSGLEVPDGAADQVISLGSLSTVENLVVKSDRAVSFKVNGVAAGSAGTLLAQFGASITTLAVSNASGAKAFLRIAMVGT